MECILRKLVSGFIIAFITGFSFAIPERVAGQDYIEYQRIWNRVDEDVFADELATAVKRLDTVYNGYDFIYAKHCMKALQISCMTNDSVTGNKWLAKSFIQGVPLWIIRTDSISSKSLEYLNCQPAIAGYDSLRSVYKSALDASLSARMDSLIKIDTRYTSKVNDGFWMLRHTLYGLQWLRNNRRQFGELRNIIADQGFPGERAIGLLYLEDSAKNAAFVKRAGLGLVLEERTVLFMLIHYYSTRHDDINDLLHKNIETGRLPPHHYAHLNDFVARHNKRGRYPYYYFHQVLPTDASTVEANKLRAAIGLNTIEQQRRNRETERERRKMGKPGIILE